MLGRITNNNNNNKLEVVVVQFDVPVWHLLGNTM